MRIELDSKYIKYVIFTLLNSLEIPYQVVYDMLINEFEDYQLENFLIALIDKVKNIE